MFPNKELEPKLLLLLFEKRDWELLLFIFGLPNKELVVVVFLFAKRGWDVLFLLKLPNKELVWLLLLAKIFSEWLFILDFPNILLLL